MGSKRYLSKIFQLGKPKWKDITEQRGTHYKSTKDYALLVRLNKFPLLVRKERASRVAQMVKRLPAVWETLVRSLGWEDPLEKEMATHSSTLAWKIPCTEEPGRLQSMGSQTAGHDWATSRYCLSQFALGFLLFVIKIIVTEAQWKALFSTRLYIY